jgi:hypothetical protein
LLYSLWRPVDLLVQLQFRDEYERDPLVTANDVLTLVKKRTGVLSDSGSLVAPAFS